MRDILRKRSPGGIFFQKSSDEGIFERMSGNDISGIKSRIGFSFEKVSRCVHMGFRSNLPPAFVWTHRPPLEVAQSPSPWPRPRL